MGADVGGGVLRFGDGSAERIPYTGVDLSQARRNRESTALRRGRYPPIVRCRIRDPLLAHRVLVPMCLAAFDRTTTERQARFTSSGEASTSPSRDFRAVSRLRTPAASRIFPIAW